MRFSTATTAGPVSVASTAGAVVFNGATLLPHEAALLADALIDCANHAEKLAADTRAASATRRGLVLLLPSVKR